MSDRLSKSKLQAMVATNLKSQIQIYIYPIEVLLGYVICDEKEISACVEAWRADVAKSSAFGSDKPELINRVNGESVEVDTMFIKPITKHLPHLIKAGNSVEFKTTTSDTNKLIKRNIEIFSFSHRVTRYERARALDFSNINYLGYGVKGFSDLLDKLCYRDSTDGLLKEKIQIEIVKRLDDCKEKDNLEWRLMRLLISLLILKKQNDVGIIADILLDQLKQSVEAEG